MIFNYEKLKKILKAKKINAKELESPIKIAISLLKSKLSLKQVIKKKLQEKYASYVAEILKPNPKDSKERTQKRRCMRELPKILEAVNQSMPKIAIATNNQKIKLRYQDFKQIFESLDKKFGKKRKSQDLLQAANPFLTASISDSYNHGLGFQTKAKYASSVEGTWGAWIEDAMIKFNPKIIRVNAAGVDLILGQTSYDLKAGPNVFNSGQVAYNHTKRKIIQKLGTDKNFKKLVLVKDFKVAISYGREKGAIKFMQNQGDLIIFGPDTWKELTGDEWNAFKLFLWQIRFKKGLKNSKWDKPQLEKAVRDFIQINYGDDRKKLKKALSYPEYRKLKRSLPK